MGRHEYSWRLGFLWCWLPALRKARWENLKPQQLYSGIAWKSKDPDLELPGIAKKHGKVPRKGLGELGKIRFGYGKDQEKPGHYEIMTQSVIIRLAPPGNFDNRNRKSLKLMPRNHGISCKYYRFTDSSKVKKEKIAKTQKTTI